MMRKTTGWALLPGYLGGSRSSRVARGRGQCPVDVSGQSLPLLTMSLKVHCTRKWLTIGAASCPQCTSKLQVFSNFTLTSVWFLCYFCFVCCGFSKINLFLVVLASWMHIIIKAIFFSLILGEKGYFVFFYWFVLNCCYRLPVEEKFLLSHYLTCLLIHVLVLHLLCISPLTVFRWLKESSIHALMDFYEDSSDQWYSDTTRLSMHACYVWC